MEAIEFSKEKEPKRQSKQMKYYYKNIQESRRKSRERNDRYKKSHPERVIQSGIIYRNKNRERLKHESRVWRENNLEKSRENCRIYQKNNPEIVNKLSRKWRHNNKEKRQIIEENRLRKIQTAYNFNSISKVGFALYTWSKKIRTQYNNLCQVCGKTSSHTHHILFKQYYPNLALNENNGIPLCLTCHKEVHGRVLS